MTWALCFNCGSTKFGALLPCPECQAASTGDISLDIAFSDHHMAVESLEEFGAVVRAIRQVCEDDQLRFWSFIYYVSTRHPRHFAGGFDARRPGELRGHFRFGPPAGRHGAPTVARHVARQRRGA